MGLCNAPQHRAPYLICYLFSVFTQTKSYQIMHNNTFPNCIWMHLKVLLITLFPFINCMACKSFSLINTFFLFFPKRTQMKIEFFSFLFYFPVYKCENSTTRSGPILSRPFRAVSKFSNCSMQCMKYNSILMEKKKTLKWNGIYEKIHGKKTTK